MIDRFLLENELGFSQTELDAYLNCFICFNQISKLNKFLNLQNNELIILAENIKKELENDNLKYSLSLDTNQNINFYAENLILWLEQFLLAFEFLKPDLLLNADILEIIADFAELKKLDSYNLEDNQENWQSLSDLEQHCKMGILYIFNSFNS